MCGSVLNKAEQSQSGTQIPTGPKLDSIMSKLKLAIVDDSLPRQVYAYINFRIDSMIFVVTTWITSFVNFDCKRKSISLNSVGKFYTVFYSML